MEEEENKVNQSIRFHSLAIKFAPGFCPIKLFTAVIVAV